MSEIAAFGSGFLVEGIRAARGYGLPADRSSELVRITRVYDRTEPLFGMFDGLQRQAADLGSSRIGQLRPTTTAELSEHLIPTAIPLRGPAPSRGHLDRVGGDGKRRIGTLLGGQPEILAYPEREVRNASERDDA